LFSRRGIDKVTIAQIGEKAGVAGSTVYALYRSKEGILRALMEASLFGPRFRAAQTLLSEVTDPVRMVALTANIAKAIYEGEDAQLGLLRGVSGFSPSLKKIESEFETTRYRMQEERLRALHKSSRMKSGITFEEARRIMWMYTSRDVYRMLVHESGWTPDRYQEWLSETLVRELVAP
jgi:AcrR family transcriptional regulator